MTQVTLPRYIHVTRAHARTSLILVTVTSVTRPLATRKTIGLPRPLKDHSEQAIEQAE